MTTPTGVKAQELMILNEFVNWVGNNYSHSKGGYRHRGDFYKNDKPVNLLIIKNRFFKEKYGESVLTATHITRTEDERK